MGGCCVHFGTLAPLSAQFARRMPQAHPHPRSFPQPNPSAAATNPHTAKRTPDSPRLETHCTYKRRILTTADTGNCDAIAKRKINAGWKQQRVFPFRCPVVRTWFQAAGNAASWANSLSNSQTRRARAPAAALATAKAPPSLLRSSSSTEASASVCLQILSLDPLLSNQHAASMSKQASTLASDPIVSSRTVLGCSYRVK